jgi:hypothetical protein
VILLIPAFLGVLPGLTVPLVDIKLDPLASPYNFAPPLVGIWMVAGIVLFFVVRARDSAAVSRLGDVMSEG